MNNLAYRDDGPIEELLDGKLVAMSPRPGVNHNIVAGNIFGIFKGYLKGKRCIPFCDGTEVHLSEKDLVVPDVMIICNRDIIKRDGVYGAPDLIVEVLSHSTAKHDKGYKKKLYEQSGVKEYWIVEVGTKSIEVYWLKGGAYELIDVYSIFPDFMLQRMNEEEKGSIEEEFRTSLFDDLLVSLEDVFENVL